MRSAKQPFGIAYSEGTEFPPITIWKCTEDNKLYLVDGFHRAKAAKKAGIEELPFIEKSGTYREALLFSLGVNATHGLRRSNADKRKAVMTLLEDSEWRTWSNVAITESGRLRLIASQCGVSESFVRKIKKDSIFAQNEDTKVNNLRKVKRGGKVYIQDTTNIGKGKSSESLPPEEDNEIISESLSEDIEVEVTTSSFEENNLVDNAPVEIDDSNNDDELTDSTNTKTIKGKQKLTNPLSIGAQRSCTVGERVKVKDNHYFGGKEGVVTQISSPHSVIVAFDDNQRELIRLNDLDLPESLVKPQLSKPQKPQKKEIFIKEGLNYKAGVPGYGCKWYVEVGENDYRLFQEYQRQVNAPTISSCLVRAVEGQKQQESSIKTDDLLVNLSSKISYLNKQQKLFLAQKLIESDSDIFNQLIEKQYGK